MPNGDDDDVSVLRGVGDGTFEPKVDYPTGNDPRAVAVGDLNRDGWKDLVIGNYSDFGISVLLGKADGTFKPKVDHETLGNPSSAAIARLNRDRRPDIAVAIGEIAILLHG